MKGVAKSFLEMLRHFKNIVAPVSLCCNKGGESALSPRGGGAWRGDIFYCQKV